MFTRLEVVSVGDRVRNVKNKIEYTVLEVSEQRIVAESVLGKNRDNFSLADTENLIIVEGKYREDYIADVKAAAKSTAAGNLRLGSLVLQGRTFGIDLEELEELTGMQRSTLQTYASVASAYGDKCPEGIGWAVLQIMSPTYGGYMNAYRTALKAHNVEEAGKKLELAERLLSTLRVKQLTVAQAKEWAKTPGVPFEEVLQRIEAATAQKELQARLARERTGGEARTPGMVPADTQKPQDKPAEAEAEAGADTQKPTEAPAEAPAEAPEGTADTAQEQKPEAVTPPVIAPVKPIVIGDLGTGPNRNVAHGPADRPGAWHEGFRAVISPELCAQIHKATGGNADSVEAFCNNAVAIGLRNLLHSREELRKAEEAEKEALRKAEEAAEAAEREAEEAAKTADEQTARRVEFLDLAEAKPLSKREQAKRDKEEAAATATRINAVE